ncbi:SOS response-associated peptidase family protein [Arthrobacter sp. NA-172]|uniref:SOS response-associated peptidase family protein n=1 Tax=Arthrobacter sp. NA-172 TaxID=3367524 RepID=UPI00375471B7
MRHDEVTCGRYVVSKSTADLMAAFDVHESYVDGLQRSYNVAPTDTVPLILERNSGEDTPSTPKRSSRQRTRLGFSPGLNL